MKPNFIIKILISSTLLIVYSYCHASPNECKDYRDKELGQQVLNACSAEELEFETKKINATYSRLLKVLNQEDRQLIKNVQLAWIKYRDLKCGFDSHNYIGGSLHSYVLNTCLIDMSKQRNDELNIDYKEYSSR